MTHHVSPSQVSTAQDCWRKWGYSRTRPRTENEYAKFGTEVHAVLEQWLRHGVAPDPNTKQGRCALTGIDLLPAPRTCTVEVPIALDMGGVRWSAFADVVIPGWGVIDHKTTGDKFEHVKSEADLLDDPQRIVYGHWFALQSGLDQVTCTWIYYPRNATRAALAVSVTESSVNAKARFDRLVRDWAAPIIKLHGWRGSVTEAEWFSALPRDLRSCSKYGACPHKNECLVGVDPIEIATAVLGR